MRNSPLTRSKLPCSVTLIHSILQNEQNEGKISQWRLLRHLNNGQFKDQANVHDLNIRQVHYSDSRRTVGISVVERKIN